MTPDARTLVRESWDAAAGDGALVAALGERFYARLFALDPTVRPLFAATDMAAQRGKLLGMLGVIVAALDDPDRLVPAAAGLAARHVGYGALDRHYAPVGEALRGAFADVLGARATPAVLAAWAEAYALLAAVMRRGADAVRAGAGPGAAPLHP